MIWPALPDELRRPIRTSDAWTDAAARVSDCDDDREALCAALAHVRAMLADEPAAAGLTDDARRTAKVELALDLLDEAGWVLHRPSPDAESVPAEHRARALELAVSALRSEHVGVEVEEIVSAAEAFGRFLDSGVAPVRESTPVPDDDEPF